MTTPSSIINTRVPEAIRDLPHFDGNPKQLRGFINRVDTAIKYIPNDAESTLNFVVLNAIRSKITDQASEYLDEQNTPLDWTEIKTDLVSRFADKRDEIVLIQDLNRLKQNGDTVENFHFRIKEIKNKLNNLAEDNEQNQEVLNSKIMFYEKLCLNAFLGGLRGPLGGNVYCMQPQTLEEAHKHCSELQKIYNTRNDFDYRNNNRNSYYNNNYSNNNYNNQNLSNKHNNRNNSNNDKYNPNKFNNRGNSNNNYRYNNNYNPNQYSNQNNYNRYDNRNYFSNENQSGNYRQNSNKNVFAPNPNQHSHRITEPMDTSSGNTRLNSTNTRFSNNNSRFQTFNQNRPGFISKDLFNFNDNVTTEVEDENFQERASKHQSDT